jgi:hypothetical protein
MQNIDLSTHISSDKSDKSSAMAVATGASGPAVADCRSVLQQLAAEARDEIRLGDEAGATMLHHYMAAGDAIEKALQRVSGNKKVWLRENGFVVRTAFLYVRLARHREQIEAEMSRLSTKLSLRAAQKLIGSSKPKESEAKESEAKESEANDGFQRDEANHNRHGADDVRDVDNVRDTNEERQILRDLVLEEYFAQATGSDIFDRITKARGAIAHTEYLDRLTVNGMLKFASDEFRRQLCAKLPGKSKKFKTETAVQTGRDPSGKPVFTLQGRGGHSRFN